MNKKIQTVKNFRLFLLKQIEGLTSQQLNAIPSGYNNNIIWNLAHLTGTVQILCYLRAGLPMTIDDKYFAPFATGTRPEGALDEQEIANIKKIFITSIDRLQSDFEKKIFGNYTPSAMIAKVYGVEVTNIDEAIDYLLYHEGLHAGYILSLKHLV